MDGLEATRRIVHHYSTHDSKQRRRPIIIGLSADAMTEQEDEGLLNGMDKYLRKPVLKKDLVSALHEFVAERSIPSSNDLN
ncbi:hypothetical protein BCR44DRAFT_1288835 [Catenaria anguillulae PL171]|uniref:Response regulatory domain-containing protein n=1 Tax=Catenaria anguillulae PL171 TaxID=765915 RepID=A0A1Y2H877_9FUNG|nr:hypothetical protein BCR44DRAFT_1288835 [Catenaria anguillulae PL171]